MFFWTLILIRRSRMFGFVGTWPRSVEGSRCVDSISSGPCFHTYSVHSDSQMGAASPALPDPSGHFAIGRADFNWIDESRLEPLSTTPALTVK